MGPHGGGDSRSVSARGDNAVASGQDCFGDVDSQASSSAGDEPHFLSSHWHSPHFDLSDYATDSLFYLSKGTSLPEFSSSWAHPGRQLLW